MINNSVRIISLVLLTSPLLASSTKADSSDDKKPVACPVIVDRETGKFSKSKAKYRCYKSSSSARKAGYSGHSFDDDSNCSPTPTPSPENGTPTGDLGLSGPGEKESTVFLAPSGGTITYSFPGSGEFEIKVMSASSGKRLEQVLEISQAGDGTTTFSGQASPIFVKVQGSGAWAVAIDIN